jgi:LuxR family maltose regulon positive regulatory protein
VQYGLQLADLLLTDRLRERNLPIAVQALLLRARLHALRREARLSQADTLEALGLAAPEKYISIFLEEGEPAANLLREVARNKPLKDLPGHFLKALLGAFHVETALPAGPHAGEDGLIEPLTRRELEVLRLIAAGDSNQEIAGKLVITLSAVKKHTGNIFRKLGVNSRTLAAVRARKLGLLESE